MKDYFADIFTDGPTDDVSTELAPVVYGEHVLAQSPTPAPQEPELSERELVGAVLNTAADIVKHAIDSYTQYAMYVEEQKTERKRISAQLEAVTRAINAKKEIVLHYLDQHAEARKNLYADAEKALDHAISINDSKAIRDVLNFMLTVYEEAPSIDKVERLLTAPSNQIMQL